MYGEGYPSYPGTVPRDEELRKVAEDLRALGRSLARDVRNAVEDAVRSGRPPFGAVRDGLRGVADETHRAMRQNWAGHRTARRSMCGPPWMRPGPPSPGPPGSQPASGPPWARPGAAPPWARAEWGPPRRRRAYPPVRRKWDAVTVVGLLAVLFGVAWLLGGVGAFNVPIEGVLAVGLMVLGAAVIITARTDWSLSRHAWPVLLGLVLLVAVVATSSGLGVPGALRHASFGNMTRTAAAGKTVYGGFGTLTVDTSKIKAGDTFTVESDAGQTTIKTAPSTPLLVHAQVLGGQVCVDGKRLADGVDARVDEQFGGQPGARVVVVNVRQLFGQIIIDGQGCGQ